MIRFDASALITALKAIQAELPAVIEGSLDTLAEIGATNAKSTRLYRNRTGLLRRETKWLKAGALMRTVIADTGYASYIENGNDPGGGRIYPRRAKALRFVIDGKVIFRKSVRAAKPRPFMAEARRTLIQFIPSLIESDLERLFQKHKK